MSALKTVAKGLDPETVRLIHSLKEHQIELEMQNEELKLAKAKAELATEKYLELYDFAPTGYFTLSEEGQILELNLSGSQMLGKDRISLIDSKFAFFVSDETKPLFNDLLASVFHNKDKETCEIRLEVAGMPSRFVQLFGIISGSGKNCLLTAMDITSRKISEDKLLKSRLLMKSSMESQKDMILLSVDLQYRYLYFNSAHLQLMKLAYNQDVEIGRSILEYVNSEQQRVKIRNHFDRAFKGESYTIIWKFGNGILNYYESFFNPILNENSQVIGATAFSRDVTDRKNSEELLKDSKLRLDKTQQMAHLGSWELDLLTGQLFWSDEVYRIFGLLPQEFEATFDAFLESVHPEDRDSINMAYFGSIEENKSGYEIEHRVIRRNTGELRYVFERCEHIRNQEGQIIRSVGMVQDITEHKLSELALVESEGKFRSFVQFSSDPIFSFNRDETYRFVNEAFTKPFGKKPHEVIGKTPFVLFSFEEAERRLSLVRKVFQSGEKGEIEVEVVSPTLGKGYFLTTADPYKDEFGNVLYVNCVSKDISQLKRVEKALKESEAQITAILAAIPDMIFILNKDGVYLDYCGPLSDELYLQPEYFIGKKIKEVLPSELAQQFADAFTAAINTKKIQLCEYSLNLPNGLNYFEAKIVAYGESRLLTISRNVSAYKTAEATIKLKNADLQRINAEKDKFFSIIAHDLRGPFSGFLGLTETLAKRLPDMTLKEIHEITLLMRNSAVHLFRLLGNLLEWSRMQRGLIAYTPKPFLVEPNIKSSILFASEVAKYKEITIKSSLVNGITVFADENMFESIVRNLISNAIKYTTRGGEIMVSTKIESNNLILISVEDTGIGMDSVLIDQLFRIDVRSNRKGTEGENSSGLGLILCKDFIEKNGGTLMIESKVGKGSVFRFTLPGNQPSTAE